LDCAHKVLSSSTSLRSELAGSLQAVAPHQTNRIKYLKKYGKNIPGYFFVIKHFSSQLDQFTGKYFLTAQMRVHKAIYLKHIQVKVYFHLTFWYVSNY
jgi:hypothetical protein